MHQELKLFYSQEYILGLCCLQADKTMQVASKLQILLTKSKYLNSVNLRFGPSLFSKPEIQILEDLRVSLFYKQVHTFLNILSLHLHFLNHLVLKLSPDSNRDTTAEKMVDTL